MMIPARTRRSRVSTVGRAAAAAATGVAGVALAALLASTACRDQAPFHGNVIADPLPAPALRLDDPSGQRFDLSAQKGRVILLYFGYTHCPDVCPTTLADFARAIRMLSDKQRNGVHFVFMSVDPARDTPAVTEAYVRKFDTTFAALAPTAAKLDSIKTTWGFAVERDSMPGMKSDSYGVSHPAGVFVIDRLGNVRMIFNPGIKAEDIAFDLKRIL